VIFFFILIELINLNSNFYIEIIKKKKKKYKKKKIKSNKNIIGKVND